MFDINPKSTIVFFLSAGWALFFGFVLQMWIYPQFFISYWGHGLLAGDAVTFHNFAIRFAEAGRIFDFNFSIVPHELFPAAILGIMYKVTGIQEPWVFLFLNSIIYGAAAVVLFNILQLLGFHRGRWWGSLMFIFSPTGIVYFSQVHRDVFVLLGYFLIMWGLCELIKNRPIAPLLLKLVLGGAVLFFFRPYLLIILSIVVAAAYLIVIRRLKFLSHICLLALMFAFYRVAHVGQLDSKKMIMKATPCRARTMADYLTPDRVSKMLCSVQNIRLYFIETAAFESDGKGYKRWISYENLEVGTTTAALKSLPDLIKISFFEPLIFIFSRDIWTGFSYMVLLETIILGISCLVMLRLLFIRFNLAIAFLVGTSSFMAVVQSAASPNLSSLYRTKFLFLVLISAIGVSALREFIWINPKKTDDRPV